jgi:NAD(P)H-quinone oxidoreductase subunit 5
VVPSLSSLFLFDWLSIIMLALIGLLAVVIVRFSGRYLDGQKHYARYRRWLFGTLAATTVLVSAGNLLLLALAWIVSSLCVHRLLMFFPDRREAQIAAHKKFLFARLGDVLTLAGVVCIGRATGTFNIMELMASVPAAEHVSTLLETGGFLLAAGVIVRSALLPFHGWLIQVMEAPTPTSALLHAGVVNIGGFVMLRLATLMVVLEPAQTLLVVFGATTAVLASLVMMTRITVKVSLAWSTCAQMGFMLLECGLGAYSLALVHLVAHSVYKAHAFLAAGNRVQQHLRVEQARAASGKVTPNVLVPTVVTIALFALWHHFLPSLIPQWQHPLPSDIRSVFAGLAVVALVVVQTVLVWRPIGAFAKRCYPHFLAGLYIDDVMTRVTFALCPPRDLPAVKLSTLPNARPLVLREVPS